MALVTEGAQRPELPAPEDLPGTGGFAGYSEYIMLMEQCWDQDPAARPTFAQVTPPSPPHPPSTICGLNLWGHFPFTMFSSVRKEYSCMLFYFQVSCCVVALLLVPSVIR